MNQENRNKLIDAAIAIETEEAKEAKALGYMARVFAQASLPYNQVNENYYIRNNGLIKLKVISDPEIGVPFGAYPRLLMSWITTEAVLTNSHTLALGHTLTGFMSELGLIPSGGKWGTIPRLKDQMLRLFSSTISSTYSTQERNIGLGLRVVTTYDLWWNPSKPNQSSLWESTLTLSKDFFDEIIKRPVPIDLRVLKAIKQSPMKLDIYCWLTYRMSYLKKPTEIPWEVLAMQLGADYARTKDFKKQFLKNLKEVMLFYNAKVSEGNSGLLLKPSLTHVKQLIGK